MNKLLLVFMILTTVLVSGCSILEGVNDTLRYADEATDHVNMLLDFSQDAPQMIKDAVSNPDVKNELEDRLLTVKENIAEFNQIDAPAIADSVHQQLVEKNKEIQAIINEAMVNGELVLEKIENSQLLELINDVTKLLDQLEQLGL